MQKIIFIQGIHNSPIRNKIILSLLQSLSGNVVYFPLFYTLEQTDKQLELIKTIDNYLEKSEGDHIILGHSFGGIITYSLKEKNYRKVSQIITVASPHTVPFIWFKEILSKLPYKTTIKVNKQKSYGFLFDMTVPYLFTKYPQVDSHKTLLGTHNILLKSETFIKKIYFLFL